MRTGTKDWTEPRHPIRYGGLWLLGFIAITASLYIGTHLIFGLEWLAAVTLILMFWAANQITGSWTNWLAGYFRRNIRTTSIWIDIDPEDDTKTRIKYDRKRYTPEATCSDFVSSPKDHLSQLAIRGNVSGWHRFFSIFSEKFYVTFGWGRRIHGFIVEVEWQWAGDSTWKTWTGTSRCGIRKFTLIELKTGQRVECKNIRELTILVQSLLIFDDKEHWGGSTMTFSQLLNALIAEDRERKAAVGKFKAGVGVQSPR